MTNIHPSEPDDRSIASLLKLVDHDAPSPDMAVLDAIGVIAAAAFDDAGDGNTGRQLAEDSTGKLTHPARQKAGSDGITLTIVRGDEGSNSLKKNPRRHPMFAILASRALASMAAIASTIALWFAMSFSSSPVSATPFSKVLSELQRADSMQFKIVRDGNSADVWVRSPGLVRYQESAQKYQIAAGSRLWKIDEDANTVEETDSPWFLSPQERIDLLSLLGSDITDATRLMTARPVEQTTRDGRDCLIYRTSLPAKGGQIDIEAAVDSKNLQLLEIAAWKPENKRKGPPLAEMILVAMNVAVADEQFEVSKSLSEDGRIGLISDAQGIVVLRPRLAKRWTPVSRETILQPGDWVRTEVRGANAVKVSLTNGVAITLGPGTLVECLSQTEARLHYGMVQVVAEVAVAKAEEKPDLGQIGLQNGQVFKLLAPRDGQREINPGQSLILRTDRDEKLIEVTQKPAWLLGFEGASNNESLGSLIVTMPDGRNEPLTVGYHKVSVEIRDQIARTTIEESFVNHTESRLEGIFHFPLPQDASISGFGMWIGDELVEADVVEKQRAREIYETILRERRDPGLLEWTSGNIFKARVFPIEARSEKRIKIVYTQVLPLRANKYRYSYGLRSELLRTKPLRELSLSVTVNSAMALKKVTCPTHAARITTSGEPKSLNLPNENDASRTRRADAQPLAFHSAQVEFSAQEYSPSRDFEVVFEIDGRQNDVVVIPHQRGDDGYFLIQLTPPGPDGNWQREVLPEGDPLKLVLLCDTSMSMDEAKRRDQADFVAAVLASLGPDDQFQLVAADVATAWASDVMQPATEASLEAAKSFLADRVSLGWTNLDRAFEDVLSKVTADTQVVYIGDGLLSAGDTDGPAFVKRLAVMRTQIREKSDSAGASKSGGQQPDLRQIGLHAVTVGNTSDSVVMRGIATVGGGSSRVVSGEQTPRVVATELLNEIAQPGLKDLKVDFKGVKVAAVYPEQLPNVAAGTQQILVGRYLPEGQDQQGEVIITGKRGNEAVRYAARIDLKNAEDGNSFIPRLWARSHLDFLLAQGTNSAIQEDVIRLSEEFHIITPYTSLLVLETDADRERFGVKRRFEMRDGERFFAQGRANANFELLQQQMKLAGSWRANLRRQVLRELEALGRDASVFNQQQEQLSRMLSSPFTRVAGPLGSNERFGRDYKALVMLSDGTSSVGGFGDDFGVGEEFSRSELNFATWDTKTVSLGDELDVKDSGFQQAELAAERDKSLAFKESQPMFLAYDEQAESLVGLRVPDDDSEFNSPFGGGFGGRGGAIPAFAKSQYMRGASDKTKRGVSFFSYADLDYRGYNQPDYTSWINTLFPDLPAAETEPAPNPEVEDRKSKWTPEAIELAKSLLRVEQLQAIDGGVEVRRDVESFDPRWKRSTSRTGDTALYSPKSWATRGMNSSDQTIVNFCDETSRGAYSVAFGLGRVRPSIAKELQQLRLPLTDYSISSIFDSFKDWKAAVEKVDDKTSQLILTADWSKSRYVFEIDTERRVILKLELFEGDKLQSSTRFEDFVQVAGTWWARHVQSFDADNQRATDITLDVQQLTPDQFNERMTGMLSEKASTQFLQGSMPRLKVARQKVADGGASFDDRMIMILHNARLQQWDEMWKHVEEAEKLAADKAGVRWIRTILLKLTRRHEEARLRLIDEAKKLAAVATHDEVFLAEFVLGQLNGMVSAQEFDDAHHLLKPVYFRPLAERIPQPMTHWLNDAAAEQNSRDLIARQIADNWTGREAASLELIGKPREALAVYKSIAESRPWDVYAQQGYTDRVQQIEGLDVAEAWLRKELARPERTDYDQSVLPALVFNLLKQQAKWEALLQWTKDWIGSTPNDPQYYTAYGYHLAALIYGDQVEQANALAEQWLREARIEGELSPAQRQKFDAALNFLNGQVPNMHFQRQDEKPFEWLAESARYYATHEHHFDLVNRCFSNHYFGQSSLSDKLRGEWLMYLRANAATIPADRLSSLIGWTLSGRISLVDPMNDKRELDASEVPDQFWSNIAATLKDRWLKAETKIEKQRVGDVLVSVYSNRFRNRDLLPFLRERITRAANDEQFEPTDRAAYIAALFDELLRTEWTMAIEAEAFATLQQLSVETDPHVRLLQEVPALMRLVDTMLANRIVAEIKQLRDQGESDKLTRKELAEKKREIRDRAHGELSQTLTAAAARADGPIGDWFRIEHIWIDVGLGHNLEEAQSACWKILGDVPPKVEEPSDDEDGIVDEPTNGGVVPPEPKDLAREFLEQQLKARSFVTLMNLASRPKADAASVDRLIRFVDAGIALGGKSAAMWKQAKFQLLVALDRPDDLEAELRQWIRDDASMTPWRQRLAQLLAERGQLAEAATLFEACEKDKLLTAQNYRSLANWYLTLNRRADYERAQLEAYRQMSEQELGQILSATSNRWSRQDGTLPSEISEETLFAIRVLLEKSGSPEQYFRYIKSVYMASRDFRMLKLISDSVLGRTAQRTYSILQTIQTQILQEIRNEATADELITRIKELRTRQQTPVDGRALDLLEAMVERRSAEVLNQPGPHVEACVNAMKRSFEHEWSEGEPHLMAAFLHQLGKLPHDGMKNEQLRQLRALHRMAPALSRLRLRIATELSELLFYNYGDQAGGLALMEVEVREYTQANNDTWPHEDIDHLFRYIGLLESAQQFSKTETVLTTFIAKPVHSQQASALEDRLGSLYIRAFDADGAVSIGTGRAALFEPIFAMLKKDLTTASDENRRYARVVQIVDLLQTAHRHKMVVVAEAARELAFEIIPGVLPHLQENYRETVACPMSLFREVFEKKTRLQYVVERLEEYPQRYLFHHEPAWDTLGQQLAAARQEVGASDLDDRILQLVLPQLRRYLTSHNAGYTTICHQGYAEFWREKSADFAKLAEQILNEQRDSGRRAFRVAQYLHDGLGRIPRAIEILLIARGQGRLDENMDYTLVRWLRDANRLPEAIGILESLTKLRPNHMLYRTDLMSAYFAAQRFEQLQQLIEQIDAHFHTKGLWTEGNAAQFAAGCLAVNELARAKKYMTEAIVLHQRANPNSGVNDQTLSSFYQQLASMETTLGNTREAVTAAMSAISCWSSRHEYRAQTLESLKSILRSAKDLDGLVKQLDGEAEQSGQENPILRKAIGQIWQERGEHAKAIVQLNLALELQPNDRETHQALIKSFDASDNPTAASVQLRKLIDLMPNDLTLYSQLADRLKDNPAQSERAATSIVESSPNEAEPHQMYAERLQSLNRWSEAIPHWQQVARYRKLEPTGLLKLAEAQLHEKQFDAAKTTLKTLHSTMWPSRFSDVDNQIRNLENQLPQTDRPNL